MNACCPSRSLKLFEGSNAHTTQCMAPLGVATPGFQLVVCSDVRLIVIKSFYLIAHASRSHAQGVLYTTGPLIESRVFLTELFFSNAPQ